MSGGTATETRKCCCISHEFFHAASANPNKIAVIHASGVAKLSRERRRQSRASLSSSALDELLENRAISHYPPFYLGDRSFTYSDVLNAVDSLTSRLCSVLLGSEDPFLIRRKSQGNNSNAAQNDSSSCSVPLMPNLETWVDSNDKYKPKVVGIYMPPSVEYVIAVLAVLRCGEAFMPLDPFWPNERILNVVSASNADLVIGSKCSFGKTESDHLDESHWLVQYGNCPVLSFSIDQTLQECVHPMNLEWPCESVKQRLFCYLIHTSGSTGRSKGVCGTEQGILNRFLWMQELYPMGGEEISLFKTSISFIDHLQEFLCATLTASLLVVPPFSELKDNVFSLVDFLQAYYIHRLTAVPSLMRTILSRLRSQYSTWSQSSLRLLLLSGEVLPLSLWKMLADILPEATILNLYGSTEVSGDCTYFDCKNLSRMLEMETLTTVPIGLPISNCDVVLVGVNNELNEGELYVSGHCLCSGYYCNSNLISSDFVKLPENVICGYPVDGCENHMYFRTGDFAKQLKSGDFIFIGRKDRTIKVNGQRIALEEVEDTIREHQEVDDAAVIFRENEGQLLLAAFIILKEKKKQSRLLKSSIKIWMAGKLPSAVVPNHFVFTESFPLSSTGKVDYESLAGSTALTRHEHNLLVDMECSNFLHTIKKAFCDVLLVEEVSDDDDFFKMGGNSLGAAHIAHILGFNMRYLYYFPTPLELCKSLLEEKESCYFHSCENNIPETSIEKHQQNLVLFSNFETGNHHFEARRKMVRTFSHEIGDTSVSSKRLKGNTVMHVAPESYNSRDWYPLRSFSKNVLCSFSRCNKVRYEEDFRDDILHESWSGLVPRAGRGQIQEFWKVYMESCVDASPTIAVKGSDVYLFIGAHSYRFLCVNAKSGHVQWEVILEGRIECSAAILFDVSQVVVGCYGGKIYFLNYLNGDICWSFQTSGEVKCQPVVDVHRKLVWCGSHDHNLYALNYIKHCCVYKVSCGGSIYGSPVVDEVHSLLYVASTSGCVTAVSLRWLALLFQMMRFVYANSPGDFSCLVAVLTSYFNGNDLPFYTLWTIELEVPVFSSLTMDSSGVVICCLVDGHVLALNTSGSVIWKRSTGGPIFAGACTSSSLPSQVLICSRNGGVYSFNIFIISNLSSYTFWEKCGGRFILDLAFQQEEGDILWEYNVGNPITASAYVDEHLILTYATQFSDRLVCICSSSGTIVLLRVKMDSDMEMNCQKIGVEEFARLDLQGDVFSSPLMIGGRIFVGCRDDYLHCLDLEISSL